MEKKTYIVENESTGFSTAIKLSEEQAKAIEWFINWSEQLGIEYCISLAEDYAIEL